MVDGGAYQPEALRTALSALPRIRLAHLPTPLEYSPGLSRLLGIELYIKRDDLTGLAFGGNKTRNLEFRLAEAVESGCDPLILEVQVTSNSARQTAAAGNRLGLHTVLFLRGDEVEVQGNLLIDLLLGAELHHVPDDDSAAASAITEYCDQAAERGLHPFLLNQSPMFGVAAAAAYLECWLEIRDQLRSIGRSADLVYVTSGGKGQAGLELARAALGEPFRVVGVAVSQADRDRRSTIAALALQTAGYLDLKVEIDVESIINNRNHVGPGYGVPGPDAIESIQLSARHDALLLDPVYTGKGMAALIDDARSGQIPTGATVVFIHTGGLPALFNDPKRLLEKGGTKLER